MSPHNRMPGYYVVKHTESVNPELAFFAGDHWKICGCNCEYFDDDFEYINENRIDVLDVFYNQYRVL